MSPSLTGSPCATISRPENNAPRQTGGTLTVQRRRRSLAVWLLSLGFCLVSTLATAQEQSVREQAYTARLAEHGFPEAATLQALEAALRPAAPWSDVEAAIRHFAFYAQHPWAPDVLAAAATRHAEHVILNADYLWRLQPQWTAGALDMLATARPTLMLRHAAVVLAADRHAAPERLRQAALRAPASAVSLVRTYEAEPWGHQLFTDAALAVPRWTVRVALTPTADGQDVLAALQHLCQSWSLLADAYPNSRAATAILEAFDAASSPLF